MLRSIHITIAREHENTPQPACDSNPSESDFKIPSEYFILNKQSNLTFVSLRIVYNVSFNASAFKCDNPPRVQYIFLMWV